ncbi:4-hydroxyphenylacetate 3-hydroxylase [Halomonas sp. ATBC28]|uniref:4-hydroxyphenylacetate 3-hydroxylase family protein n=1 Tax=Halomonadaceae TaxID=28256 RepID=UPI00110E11B4|nr:MULTISPECIES: 4-hydroxyphenylacetate 3-hydroxylase family protein [Halomonas]QNU64146.1 4-hydroxyphenylacetate 3-hydroxylase family protein [Halomonas titanicae]TMU18119.1 4-hydroxyphenylacetate 3-hydroxylase [Halomonas sp. ATBC28]
MIRTGEEYREGLRDGREIWMEGERVKDVTKHSAFKPIIDVKSRMYDMAHEPEHKDAFTYRAAKETNSIFYRPPREKQDWYDKLDATDRFLKDIGGVATRVGDETIGEMWSLLDGRDMLAEIDPRFADNIDRHIKRVFTQDIFHVSANTDPKGDRSLPPQKQDPDMMVRVVKETDAGIIIRGAKFETAAAYADQAFLKPTVGAWSTQELSDYALGCIVKMGAPGVKHICRAGFAGRSDPLDYPLANRFDEVEALVVFDNVLIPWEDVFFYRHTKSAQFVRNTLHRYSAFPYVLRLRYVADMMIGTAMWNAMQTGLDKLQPVREKLADLVCYRESINAHLTASIATAEKSPAGLLMPNQSLLYAGRVLACSQLPKMMHIARELCGGQLCVTPNAASFHTEGSKEWLDKFYSLNDRWNSEDRRKLMAFARDLLTSDYAGHRLTFVQFAQAPHFSHLAAVYNSFDFSGPLDFVRKAASLSDNVLGGD